MREEAPSSGPSDHLLPQGEKGADDALSVLSPSPLVGEGALRADEGDRQIQAPRLQQFARRMRHAPTEAEQKLWLLLRARRLSNFKFRRQVPVGPYIVDFVCYSCKLIVEADGSQHADSLADGSRDAELRRRGFRLLRFWNNDILSQPDAVLEQVWQTLNQEMAR